MSVADLAAFRDVEARLPSPDAGALERLPGRQRVFVAALAALDRGDRAEIEGVARQAREAGARAVARVLEVVLAPSGSEPAAGEGGGEVDPFSRELLLALTSWRKGKAARGTKALRQLVGERPALRGLLDVTGRVKKLSVEPRALAGLSARAPSALAAAHVLAARPREELGRALARLLGGPPAIALSRYASADPLQGLAELRRWVDDAAVPWGPDQRARLRMFGLLGGAQERGVEVIAALLPVVHRRLAAGQARGVLPVVEDCVVFARQARAPETLVRSLEALARRLGGLFAPLDYLPALLTLWRRSLARPVAERRALAERIAEVAELHAERATGPFPEAMFVIEAVNFLFDHTEELERQVGLIGRFGPMFSEAKVAEALRGAAPEVRAYGLGLHALTRLQVEPALAAVVQLVRAPETGGRASELLRRVIELIDELPSRAAERSLARALESLRAPPRHLEPSLLPMLLMTTADSEVGVEAARVIVREELARPLAEEDPEQAYHVVAHCLLGDEAGAQEVVRRLGRWLRRAEPDVADDVALAVLARVYDAIEDDDVPEVLRRVVAPLDNFVLREGADRPLRAAIRVDAASSPLAVGFGAWAAAHEDRLDDAPYWRALVEMREAYQDALEYEDDEDGVWEGDNPF